jgi:hypothetical protein
MSVTNESHHDADEKSLSDDSEARTGTGGDVLDVWTKGRRTLLRDLWGAGTVNNNSSFDAPKGIVDPSGSRHDHSFENGEKRHGVYTSGLVLTADGAPMSGEARIEKDGTAVESADASGRFILATTPQSGVTDGADVAGVEYDLRFDINPSGIDVYETGIFSGRDIGTIRYGDMEGEITDYNGDPVPNEPVSGKGGGASTDDDGFYTFSAPGGTDVTVSSLSGGHDKTKTIPGGSTLTVNWQFSGVLASATLPDGKAVPNAPVEIDTREGPARTDNGGEVQYVMVPPETEVTVTYLDTYEETVTTADEGQNVVAPMELGAGCKGTIVSERGAKAENVDVYMDVEGVPIAYSRETGRFAIGVLDPGNLLVVCSDEDRRYERADKELDLSQDDVVEVDFELTDATNIGNAI